MTTHAVELFDNRLNDAEAELRRAFRIGAGDTAADDASMDFIAGAGAGVDDVDRTLPARRGTMVNGGMTEMACRRSPASRKCRRAGAISACALVCCNVRKSR
jgi:hypothetical protein